jgi:hypothetical protein
VRSAGGHIPTSMSEQCTLEERQAVTRRTVILTAIDRMTGDATVCHSHGIALLPSRRRAELQPVAT